MKIRAKQLELELAAAAQAAKAAVDAMANQVGADVTADVTAGNNPNASNSACACTNATAPLRRPRPCEHYRLDLTGASFGVCKCGFSRPAHMVSDGMPATESLNASFEPISDAININSASNATSATIAAATTSATATTSISDKLACRAAQDSEWYRALFDEELMAVSQAMTMDIHMSVGMRQRQEQEEEGEDGQAGHTSVLAAEKMACEHYRLDLTGASFGVCKCGFSRPAHAHVATSPVPFSKNPKPRLTHTTGRLLNRP
jgi:hypothetical protein